MKLGESTLRPNLELNKSISIEFWLFTFSNRNGIPFSSWRRDLDNVMIEDTAFVRIATVAIYSYILARNILIIYLPPSAQSSVQPLHLILLAFST